MTSKPHELDATPLNRILSPQLGLIPPNSPPDLYRSALEHFLSVPWTAALLPPSSANAVPFIPQSRNPLTPQHDQLLGNTLASPRALRHLLCVFYPSDDQHVKDPTRPITRISTLCELGDGLSGHPAVMHGGMTMAIVDEAMGVLTELNTALGKDGAVFKAGTVTAALEIKFLRPIALNGAICATAWLEETERRKARVRCTVTDHEGNELAQCASTWVALKSKV